MKIIFLLITFSVFSLIAQIPQNGLMAYFPFSSNALDQSGNNASSTVFGANHTFDRFNNPNTAYYFDGNSYIQFSAGNVQNNEYTYSLWANINELPLEGEMAFALNIGSSGGDQSINISNGYFNGQTTFDGWLGGGYNQSSPGFALQERKQLETNKWTHIVCTRFSNYALLFVNGILVDSVGTGNTILPSYGTGSVNGYIGIRNSMQSGFIGTIDDIAIYNRPLSKSEVYSLFQDNSTGLQTVEKHNENLFVVYPNPSNGEIISLHSELFLQNKENIDISLYSVEGKLISKLKPEVNSNQIRLTNTLNPGVYSILVELNGKVYSDKLIVN